MDLRETVLRKFADNPELAYATLFAHRHSDTTPAFHTEIRRLWASPAPRIVIKAFRGGAKSTIAEEYLTTNALYGAFRYGLIIGNSYTRACERLTAIKHELERNEYLSALFGDCVGPVWAEGSIILNNGVKLEAFGARQSLRGAKHRDSRPDLVLCDDLEDEDNVATEEARDKMLSWLIGAVLPAMDPKGRIRVTGTPGHPDCLLERLQKDPSWVVKVYPILHPHPETGDLQPTWPARFPLDAVRALEQSARSVGRGTTFTQEYMCQAEDPQTKLFKSSHFRVASTMPSWAGRYVFVDPARTTNKQTSARTGYAVWSYIGNKILVWDAFGEFHTPDQIVNTILALNMAHSPVVIGVEPDGLEEFLLQPLRAAQMQHGLLPVRPVRAPRDKQGFIRGLQPFFEAGDITFAKALPDLQSELLAHPTGRCDVANALAYALSPKMRPGLPVYQDFQEGHVTSHIDVSPRAPVWVVFHTDGACTAAVALQSLSGALRVLGSWVMQGAPVDVLDMLYADAVAALGATPRILVPEDHTDTYANHGLLQAARRLRLTPTIGPQVRQARDSLGTFLRRSVRGEAGFLVDTRARWVVNGLAGGYARPLAPDGRVGSEPEPGLYRLAMEAVEGFAAWLTQVAEQTEIEGNVAVSRDGTTYFSLLAGRGRGR